MAEEGNGQSKLRLAIPAVGMEKKMVWLYGGLIGLVVGIGGTVGVIRAIRPPEVITAIPEPKIAEKLTDLDLVKPLCSEAFIDKHGATLCREIWCMMMTRGIDSETSGGTCDSISNINNTLEILEACQDSEDCERLFRERK